MIVNMEAKFERPISEVKIGEVFQTRNCRSDVNQQVFMMVNPNINDPVGKLLADVYVAVDTKSGNITTFNKKDCGIIVIIFEATLTVDRIAK